MIESVAVLYMYMHISLYFCPFSFGHCIVCPSSIYGFLLSLWSLQTFLTHLVDKYLTLNNVRREIVSALTIVSYDKVQGRNKAQR